MRTSLVCAIALALLAGCAANETRPGYPSSKTLARLTFHKVDTPEEAQYLGLAKDQGEFGLKQVRGNVAVLWVFGSFCGRCQKTAPRMTALHESIMKSGLADRVKIIGIASGDERYERDLFRRRYDIPFPLFTDPYRLTSQDLGVAKLPHLFVVRLTGRRPTVVHSEFGTVEDPDQLLKALREADAGGS